MQKKSFSESFMMTGKRTCLVAVSSLAITAFPGVNQAVALPTLTCTGTGLQIGQHVACGTGDFVIEPDGGINPNGCYYSLSAPQRAQCTISNLGAPTSRPVLVTFTAPGTILNDGGNTIQLDNYRMRRTAAGPTLPSISFTSGEVNAGASFYIGARVQFTRGTSVGTYSGTITINATPQ